MGRGEGDAMADEGRKGDYVFRKDRTEMKCQKKKKSSREAQ